MRNETMKAILLILTLAVTACAIEPASSAVEQRSTTCVSEPVVAGGDGDPGGDIVARCPPPAISVDQARALAVGWVQARFNAASGISVDCATWYNVDGTPQSYQCHVSFNIGALQWSGGCAVFLSGSLECFQNDD